MRRYFITYGDARFSGAKNRIVREAVATGEFDEVIAYGPEDVSEEVRNGPLWNEKRGGGYWTWKPDIICQTLSKASDGDIVVYVDAGCEVVSGREWKKYWRILEQKELIVQRIYQLNRNWTRQSVRDAFKDIPDAWLSQCQFMATVVFFKKTSFTMQLASEWRQIMLNHPEMVGDVSPDNLSMEPRELIENRHDQTILSSLVYRSLADRLLKDRISARWEHVENISPIGSQVIRAMRNNSEMPVLLRRRIREIVLRCGKTALLRIYFILFRDSALREKVGKVLSCL